MAKERLSPPLVARAAVILAALSILAPAASAQRLSAFLTPSDLAALRDEAAGVFGVSQKGDKGGAGSPARVLDAPDVACADERATNGSVTLDVCTGASGAPFGIVVDWMDVVAFARNNGWFRGDDDRLCRLRLTEPIARDVCKAVVIGGEEMLRQLRPPRHHDKHDDGHQGQTKSYDQQGDGGDNNQDGKHGDNRAPAQQQPQQPDDAVLGAESCVDALKPGTYYVFRARARGDRDAQRRDEGGDEEGKKKDNEGQQEQQQQQQDEGNKDGADEEKKRRDRTTDPSLWSDNAVCETLADGGPDVIEMVPL